MIDKNNPAQVSVNVPTSDSTVYVRVMPPDSFLDINITNEGEALEVRVTPRGRRVQVRVGPAAETSGVSSPEPTDPNGPGGPSCEPDKKTESLPPTSESSVGESALMVDTGDLEIDDRALDSLSEATKVETMAEGELFSEPAPQPDPEMPPSEPNDEIYRDRDGCPAPLEVKKSLAQLADPEPPTPTDDPNADTAGLQPNLFQLLPDLNSEDSAPNQESSSKDADNNNENYGELDDELSADLAPSGDLNYSLDDEPPQTLESELSSDYEIPKDADISLDGPEPMPVEDTNFDQPNSQRVFLKPAPKPENMPPDASTAVIVNYLEDTEDSFFEDQGQSTVLPEEEDMDIDLLDMDSKPGVLPAKPMTPVPRKAAY
ncbi:MAG: hypothetical protein LBP22_07385 [Deltaproteobacteria bacterium]|jgi:hypothetical protein|nr:hypothetical protein [Deltaproteobacteria bacterium]